MAAEKIKEPQHYCTSAIKNRTQYESNNFIPNDINLVFFDIHFLHLLLLLYSLTLQSETLQTFPQVKVIENVVWLAPNMLFLGKRGKCGLSSVEAVKSKKSFEIFVLLVFQLFHLQLFHLHPSSWVNHHFDSCRISTFLIYIQCKLECPLTTWQTSAFILGGWLV